MRQWIKARALLWTANAVALSAMVVFDISLYGRLLLGIWLAASIIVLHRGERLQHKRESERQLIRTLSHHRHDWMNELQVLYGYIRLKKIEKLQDYVDKIKETAMQESYISKLGDSELAAYLLGFRVDKRNMALEIEFEQEIELQALPLPVKKTARLLREAIELFDRYATPGDGEPNVLSLSLAVEEDGYLLFDFVYQGGYEERELRSALAAKWKAFAAEAEEESEYSENRAVVTVRLPFQG